MELLKVEDLTFSYPNRSVKALKNISFTVEKGDFIALCGASGSGKTTLLRLLKPELSPLGELSGRISFRRRPPEAVSPREIAQKIGYVAQRPEQQIVTDKVWHELAFGPENLGMKPDVIRRRVAETASFFGIGEWFERDTASLSGGQKQLLNLAAVMVMSPEILLLDEPTAQLDPIAASDFISAVVKLSRELSLTVIISEHRLEEIIPAANKLMALENGSLLEFGEVRAAVGRLCSHSGLDSGMPTAARIFHGLGKSGECPLAVREGRDLIEKEFAGGIRRLERGEYRRSPLPALEMKDIFFRYGRELPDVLRGLTLTVREKEIFCLLGGNGSGKSTALSAAAGIIKPYSGSIRVFGKKLRGYKDGSLYRNCLTLLPQDVQTVFLHNTVREELAELETPEDLPFDISPLLDSHPYDLSGGEQQLAALAKVLGTRPRLLLLDEPTKGLDAQAKENTAKLLKKLRDGGMTILAVTHDVEFAALCADRCALFFRGEVVSEGVPHEFFSENSFYTTAANRITRGFYEEIATVAEAVEICRLNERK